MDKPENNIEKNNDPKETPTNRVPLEIKPIPLKEQSEKLLTKNRPSEQKELLDIESKNPIEIIKEEIMNPSTETNLNKRTYTQKKDVEVTIAKKTPPTTKKDGQESKVEILKNTKDDPMKTKSVLKIIRTYKGDVVSTLKTQKTSLSDMVLAKKKKDGYKEVKENKKIINSKIVIIISLVIILGFGSFGIFSMLKKESHPTSVQVTQQKVTTVIFPNYKKEIILNNLKRKTITEAILFEQQDISIPLTSIIQLFFTKDDPTGMFAIEEVGKNKILITTNSFLEAFGTKTSSSLLRSISSNFMFGYHSSLGNNPFLIFEVRSYENAFAGMLEWEETIFRDLYPIFKKENSNISAESNIFQDIIIANKDVRAILRTDGKIEFAYSFLDKETLIIINNETTLREIYRRLNISKMERQN